MRTISYYYYPRVVLKDYAQLRNTDEFDIDECNLIVKILSGDKEVATTEIPLKEIHAKPTKYKSTRIKLDEETILKLSAQFTGN